MRGRKWCDDGEEQGDLRQSLAVEPSQPDVCACMDKAEEGAEERRGEEDDGTG